MNDPIEDAARVLADQNGDDPDEKLYEVDVLTGRPISFQYVWTEYAPQAEALYEAGLLLPPLASDAQRAEHVAHALADLDGVDPLEQGADDWYPTWGEYLDQATAAVKASDELLGEAELDRLDAAWLAGHAAGMANELGVSPYRRRTK